MDDLTTIDIIGRGIVLAMMLTGLLFKGHLLDCTDGNVERLIRERRRTVAAAAKARAVLAMMQRERVS